MRGNGRWFVPTPVPTKGDTMRKKGFTGIEIILLVAVIGVLGWFAGPFIGKGINNIVGGANNQQKQTYEVTEQYSMFYQDPVTGKFRPAPVPYKRSEKSLNYTTIQPPETLWQKFWKMGATAVVIIVVLSYLGLWPVITLWWNKKIKPKIEATQAQLEAEQCEKEELTTEAKRIVVSVDAGLKSLNGASSKAMDLANAATDPNIKATQLAVAQALMSAKSTFMTEMSKYQDQSTKDKVKELLKND